MRKIFSPTKGFPVKLFICVRTFLHFMYTQTKLQNIRMCNGMSSKECIFTGKKVLPNSNVQWNVFKGGYFFWEKSTPQFKIELISGEYFFPCGSKFFPGKYYSRSTFFPGNYYSGSNFFRGVIIYGYTDNIFVIITINL